MSHIKVSQAVKSFGNQLQQAGRSQGKNVESKVTTALVNLGNLVRSQNRKRTLRGRNIQPQTSHSSKAQNIFSQHLPKHQ